MLNEEIKQELAKTLTEKIGQFQCPMCHKGPFSLVDGYFSPSLLNQYHTPAISMNGIPMAAVVCDNCGFVSFHALGAIGLLNNKNNNNDNK